MQSDTAHQEFRWYEGFALCMGMIGVQISSEVIASWGNYFYSATEGTGRIVYITAGMALWAFLFGRIFDAVTDPLIGMWSDRTPTQAGRYRFPKISGRRRPFIFWGAVLMTFTAVAFWYPPVQGTSYVNFVYALLVISLHWGFFTICFVPINALGPEIARSGKARSQLGVWVGVGMIMGLCIAQVLPGVMIENFAGSGETFTPAGYQKTAVIFAIASFVCFMFPVLLVRERFNAPVEESPSFKPFGQLRDATRNPAFISYFAGYFCLYIGYLALQRMLPYWVELGMGGNEGYITFLMLPFIITAILSLPLILFVSRRVSIKWQLVISFVILTLSMPTTYFIAVADFEAPKEIGSWLQTWMGLLGTENPVSGIKAALGACVFAVCGVGQGFIYALFVPALGEIIDYDEAQLSGKRREALYNGLSGVAFKASQALSVVLFNFLVIGWGKSAAEPTGVFIVGPVAGFFGLLAIVAISFYPAKK